MSSSFVIVVVAAVSSLNPLRHFLLIPLLAKAFILLNSYFRPLNEAACVSRTIIKGCGMKIALLGAMILIAWAAAAICAEAGATEKTIGINPAYRNLSVKPGDDFEEYANGGWRKTAEIPADRASTGVGFEVFERAEKRNANLVREAAARNPQPDTPQGMIASPVREARKTVPVWMRRRGPCGPSGVTSR